MISEYDERSGKLLEGLFDRFYEHMVHTLKMNLESAEMAKYASNAFLSMKISYGNEVANCCAGVAEVDVSQVTAEVGLDPRISSQFLSPGAGFDGSCLPKDVRVLCNFAKEHGYQAPLLRAVLVVKEAQARHIAQPALAPNCARRQESGSSWPCV